MKVTNSLNIEGVTLEVVEQGDGEPVVFVHGDLSDHRTWAAQLPAFAARYRAIAYSRRYHFPNSVIPVGVDNQMAPHVRDLRLLLGALKAVPAHLVGDSWGAFISLRLAIQESGLARSLVLAEPPVLPLLNVSTPPKPRELARLLLQQPRTGTALITFGARAIAPATGRFGGAIWRVACGRSRDQCSCMTCTPGCRKPAASRRGRTSGRSRRPF
jgi:pimeloyl-ACP methyl ester carboxylesterase